MRVVALPPVGTVAAWRAQARALARAGVAPEAVRWTVGPAAPGLFDDTPGDAPPGEGPPGEGTAGPALRLPRIALATIETALCHRDPERCARAYALVLRLGAGGVRWGDRSDPAMRRLLQQEQAVRRAIHKMHAFVRFREIPQARPGRRAFAAWFEPEHPITEAASPFFADRFGDMDWIIATPAVTARLVAGRLSHAPTEAAARPPADATEDLWRTYFASIFNPARLMVPAMTAQMPRRYWKNLPEADLIPDLIRTAPERVRAMHAAGPTAPPARLSRWRARPVSPAGEPPPR
jgi:DNA polymerase